MGLESSPDSSDSYSNGDCEICNSCIALILNSLHRNAPDIVSKMACKPSLSEPLQSSEFTPTADQLFEIAGRIRDCEEPLEQTSPSPCASVDILITEGEYAQSELEVSA